MNHTYIVGTFDVAELAFLLFFVFFVGLVIYLNRESRREGYPLEDDVTGKVAAGSPLSDAGPKTFKLPHGRGTYVPEEVARDPLDIPAKQQPTGTGNPFVPTGDPMKDGVGPGAYAQRQDYPDLTMDGRPRIVPIGDAHEIEIAPNDPNIVGWPVIDANQEVAGKVSDVWVDQAEHIIRYLEVETNSGKKVLAPMPFALVRTKGLLHGLGWENPEQVEIDAITAEQFDGVPSVATAGQITRLEEEKVSAYYGGGTLYATDDRQEPYL